MALCLGICECVPKTNMPFLPCLSVTVMTEFIQGHLLCNFFIFLAWVERYMAHIGKNIEYLPFLHLAFYCDGCANSGPCLMDPMFILSVHCFCHPACPQIISYLSVLLTTVFLVEGITTKQYDFFT
uniref:Uncharacterized protein n=1 Tax=Moschus moschiferus TaxID=68415 RepID=A0A8C6CR02_MOSMO